MLKFLPEMIWLRGKAKKPGVSRVVSAFLFSAAALALAVFPESEAGGDLSGFAPAQIDAGIRVTVYADPEFCRQRGGTVQTADNQEICSDVDANDTFCIIGSADAFPCQGLLKHVSLCNDEYRRPALNPFFCGRKCGQQIPDSIFPVLARGKKCEEHVTVAGVVLSTPAATIYAAEGFASAAATVEALEGYTLNFSPHPPLEATFAVSLSSGDYVIQTLPPGLLSPATLQLTAEIVCANCIREVSLTVESVFIPVVAPPQSLFVMTPDVALLSARVTFSLPLPESYPGLSNPAFVDADGGDEFDIDANGQVSGTPARDTLATRVLRGYWTADGMLGTLVLTLTLEENSMASEMLDAALPVSARVISATAAFGYAGPVGRIYSRTTTEASLLFSPETKDGLSLAADGGVYPEIPLDGALGTEFGVVITLLAGARIRRVSVGVDVEPVFPPEQDFVIMEVGTALSGVTFNLPALENYPALSSMRFADADETDDWTINADGGVAGTLSSTPNTVTIQGWWTADGMLGTLAVDMTLRAGVTIIADEVIPNRTPTLKAAQGFHFLDGSSFGFFGLSFVMVTTALPGYKLSDPQSPEFQLPEESQRWGIFNIYNSEVTINNPAGEIWAFISPASDWRAGRGQ